MRKYSISEIDIMRNALVVLGAGDAVEDRLRTYMRNGTDPQALICRARAVAIATVNNNCKKWGPGVDAAHLAYRHASLLGYIEKGILPPEMIAMDTVPEAYRQRVLEGLAGRLMLEEDDEG